MLSRLTLCAVLTLGTAMANAADWQQQLTPRKAMTKRPNEKLAIPRMQDGRSAWNGRLIVKFSDSLRARATDDGRGVVSKATNQLATNPLKTADGIFRKYGMTTQRAIKHNETRLSTIESRAALNSGRQQPDLAGMLHVFPPAGMSEQTVLKVARELNALPEVEFVQFEQIMVTQQCDAMTANDCITASMGPGCNDVVCCETVGDINPACTDENTGVWDEFCIELAHLTCTGAAYDVCKAPKLNSGCFDEHPGRGCKSEVCCNAVCDLIPFCCAVEWDSACVTAACEVCDVGGGAAPDFTETNPAQFFQKYRTPEPVGPGTAFFDATGYSGRGLNLPALVLFADQVIDLYGAGTENLASGKTIKVGVVEHTAIVDHEDLVGNVIPEPGQTIITIPQGGFLDPNHGTATLGEIVARNNGFGVTGIAHEAAGYFFPIVSVEEGGRTLNAMASAMETFGPGDVLNYSIGPGGGGTLASAQAEWILLRTATDLGIISVLAAGNDCFNLDEDPFGQASEEEDAMVFIVGAGWSGAPFDETDPMAAPPTFGTAFCRLGFSNFCRECAPRSAVHMQAWGHNVCTLGTGDLLGACEDDPTRTYTVQFNGTSAAAPIIAGVAACMQGLAKQIYGVPLTPEQMRGVIPVNGRPQCELLDLPGNQDQPCLGDFSFEDEPNLIGAFPDLIEASGFLFAGTFFDGSTASLVNIITGTLGNGNFLSIRSDDNNYLSINTKKARIGNKVQGIVYLATGQTTDFETEFLTLADPAEVVDMAVRVKTFTQTTVAIQAVYAYNYTINRWTLLGVDIVQQGQEDPNDPQTADLETEMAFLVPNPIDHISGGEIKVRVYTAGLGATGQFKVFHDLVDVDTANQPGIIELPD